MKIIASKNMKKNINVSDINKQIKVYVSFTGKKYHFIVYVVV